MNHTKMRLEICSDSGILVNLDEQINPIVNQQVHSLAALLEAGLPPGVVEVIPGYASLLVVCDPDCADYNALVERLEVAIESLHMLEVRPAKRVEVPTIYGGKYGVDLEFVARYSGMSVERVIEVHSQADYQVYMMGFSPGFPYLGGMDSAISVPRLETPRTRVPAGSVVIAGLQTGIYTIDSPGGWQLIGYTPLRFFDINAPQPFLLKPGDRLRFIPIREGDFHDGG